ncbi:hypothetical protein Tco_0945950 [Tanacetum coccineum]
MDLDTLNLDDTQDSNTEEDDETKVDTDESEGDENEAGDENPAPELGDIGFLGNVRMSGLNSQDRRSREEKQGSNSFDLDRLLIEPQTLDVLEVTMTKLSAPDQCGALTTSVEITPRGNPSLTSLP